MWRRRSWFSLKGKAGIPGQTEGRPATSIGPRVPPVGSLQQRADACDLAADIAKAEHAQHPLLELPPDRGLPAATADGMALPEDLACAGQNERPGHLDRRCRSVAGCGDADPALLGRLHIDGGVARPGRGDQFQPRQALKLAAKELPKLAVKT